MLKLIAAFAAGIVTSVGLNIVRRLPVGVAEPKERCSVSIFKMTSVFADLNKPVLVKRTATRIIRCLYRSLYIM